MYEYESELLGESCELGTPWKGCRFATIIEDYGKELLVQVSSGAEVVVQPAATIVTLIHDDGILGAVLLAQAGTGSSSGCRKHHRPCCSS